ncbi:hypothetical protein [Rhodococcus kronopolitis]|uniref:PASTA domain-containing protein n=1 Tax=Rhodococcus kronopolitis TaxID=1460226 RepID=A0ABV9FSZ7_9NOCA
MARSARATYPSFGWLTLCEAFLKHAARSVRQRVMKRTVLTLAALALTVAGVAGCGDNDESGSSEARPTAVTSEVSPTTASAHPTTSAPVAAVPSVTRAAAEPISVAPLAAAPPPAAAPAAEPATMPNVVCMNLQAAQDRIQTAGVFFSRSVDATGAGRRQVLDANWVVVGQTPLPGSPVGEAEAVLSAVKIGEPSPC